MIDRIAAGWYRIAVAILRSIGYYQSRNEAYLSLILQSIGLSGQAGEILLDIGCGPGGISSMLADAYMVVGVDVDRRPLLNFERPTVPRLQAHAEHLPIKRGSIDVLTAISLVEHLTGQKEFFREASRVLKNGGLALVQIPEMKFPIEPHTKWPLLFAWNESLQSRVLSATGYSEVDLSTSLAKVVDFARESGLAAERVYPVWHLRKLAGFFGIPVGYFIVLAKSPSETGRSLSPP